MLRTFARGIAVAVFVSLVVATAALAGERKDIAVKDTWNLADLYPTLDAFKLAKADFAAKMDAVSGYAGKLGESAATLKAALDTYYGLEGELRRLESYAGRLSDQDTRDAAAKALDNEVSQMRVKFGAMASYIDPEIIASGESRVNGFLASEPGLKVYERPIRETFRRQKHILSGDQEKILAAAGDVAYTGMSASGLLSSADLPRVEITLSDGTVVKLTDANFVKHRRSPVKADRDKLATEFYAQYATFARTFGELLYSQMKSHKFFADARGYANTLDAALDRDEVDPAIYHNIVEAAHRNLPTFHRYLKLKARAMKVERLDYQDLYVPFTASTKIDVPYEEAQKLLAKAFVPMGKEYIKTVQRAFAERWIDVYPAEGKRSGAYASGWAYGVHPYMLLNYNDQYNDALTLAHELGHAMHSYYSNEAQPLPTSDYSIFVAEVASTFNENLLNDHMLKAVKSDDERFFLLGDFLDGTIKGTFFRQIQFAEFELRAHERVERGESLTGEELGKLYLEITRQYYGHDAGVCNVPDVFGSEWIYVPHFYYNYYVFQYSTSVAAASALGDRVLRKEPGALDAYYGLLKAGGSKGPVDILRDAGVDMTKPEAYQALMDRANRYMDEMEMILAEKGM